MTRETKIILSQIGQTLGYMILLVMGCLVAACITVFVLNLLGVR